MLIHDIVVRYGVLIYHAIYGVNRLEFGVLIECPQQQCVSLKLMIVFGSLTCFVMCMTSESVYLTTVLISYDSKNFLKLHVGFI